MIGAIRSWLASAAPGLPIDERGGAIVLGADRHPEAKVTILLFGSDGRLAAVVKVGRGPSAGPSLFAEYQALLALDGFVSGPIAGTIPRPIALGTVGGRTVLAQTPVPGDPMTTLYYSPGHVTDEEAVSRDFDAVRAWLGGFRAVTSSGSVPFDDETFELWFGAVFRRFRLAFEAVEEEEELFDQITSLARDLFGCRVPLVATHGDLGIANLLLEDGALKGVVDWELGRLASSPFADICKFPTSYASYLDRASPGPGGSVRGHPDRERVATGWSRFGRWANLHGIAYAFFGKGWFAELVRSFVERQIRDLDVPLPLFGLWFAAFVAEQAMTLPDPVFRQGYRSVLHGFAAEKESSWMWPRGARV